MEESPSFRSGLLALRLATLAALHSLAGKFSDAIEKACKETHSQVTNEYFLEMLLADWAGGKEALSGNEELDEFLSIAKHDRNAFCGLDLVEARRLAELPHCEQHTGDPFRSLQQNQTTPRGRALRVYPGARSPSHPITMAERYDAYSSRPRAPRGSVGAKLAFVSSQELGTFTTRKKRSSSRICAETTPPPGL